MSIRNPFGDGILELKGEVQATVTTVRTDGMQTVLKIMRQEEINKEYGMCRYLVRVSRNWVLGPSDCKHEEDKRNQQRRLRRWRQKGSQMVDGKKVTEGNQLCQMFW